jgi:hypothetical protein
MTLPEFKYYFFNNTLFFWLVILELGVYLIIPIYLITLYKLGKKNYYLGKKNEFLLKHLAFYPGEGSFQTIKKAIFNLIVYRFLIGLWSFSLGWFLIFYYNMDLLV